MCVDSPRKSHRLSPEGNCGQFCLKKRSQEFLSSPQNLGMIWGVAGRGRESALLWSLEKFELKDQEPEAPVRPLVARAQVPLSHCLPGRRGRW